VSSPARTTPIGCQYGVQPIDGTYFDSSQKWPPAFTAKVGPPFAQSNGDAPRFVHFLNRTDGFVYGHGAAFVTHDGGHGWSPSLLPTPYLASITGRGNMAWAVTRDCPTGTTCPFSARLSTNGGRSWSQPRALPDGFSAIDATAFGSGGLVAWGHNDLVLTSDGGTTWTQMKGKCIGAFALHQFAATPDGRQMWQLCTPFPPDHSWMLPSKAQLYLSEDGGISWSVPEGRLPAGSMLSMASPVAGTVVIGSNRQQMVVTHNAGVTWTGAEITFAHHPNHLANMKAVRFATVKDGLAFDIYGDVWATHDGGDTWADLQLILMIPYADQPWPASFRSPALSSLTRSAQP
jgi:photosystem II stability/assembly factor-like uncharacterized protein